MAAHSSILAWRIPMDRGAWWATVHKGCKESDMSEWIRTYVCWIIYVYICTSTYLLIFAESYRNHYESCYVCMYVYIYIYMHKHTYIHVRWITMLHHFFKRLFIWLHQALAAAGRIFSCSIWPLSCCLWNLAPWPGIKPRPPAPGVWSLSRWTTREVPKVFSLK